MTTETTENTPDEDDALADQENDELARLLGETPLFSGLDARYLQRLARIGSRKTYAKNDYVFREGDVGDQYYLVLEGAVRISREVAGMGEEALTVLRPGAGFGEMALIENCPRSADAVGHSKCQLYMVTKQDLEDLLFVDRDLAYDFLWKMVRVLSTRLRETTNKMAFLTFAGKFE